MIIHNGKVAHYICFFRYSLETEISYMLYNREREEPIAVHTGIFKAVSLLSRNFEEKKNLKNLFFQLAYCTF